MPLSAGDQLGPYEILALIGEGGMGEVYCARDPRLDRTVAIKVSKAAFTERFGREARAVAALNHPNVCQIYDVGANYLVMEFIEGARLKGPFPLEKAVEYAGQILDALDAAHKKGFAHRDLKPANVLVTREGLVKLLDFGLAKLTHPKEAESTVTDLTGEGQIAGTLHYMAPEQLQGHEASARSDLFSFGCLLYEILSGKLAFAGSSQASVIAAILEREPAQLDLDPSLDRVIRKCLAKRPDDRFQSARDLKTALTWAMERPLVTKGGSKRWQWATAFSALVIGALGAGWAVSRYARAPTEGQVIRLQLSSPEGSHLESGSAVLSPDGRRIAFVAAVDRGKSQVWVRSLDSASSQPLAGAEDATLPFWSPDNRSIGYFAGNRLWRTEVAGGSPIAICEANIGRGAAWGVDGSIVFASFGSFLRKVPASGGSPIPLTRLDPARHEGSHHGPHFVGPDRFLYFARSAKLEHSGLYAASLTKPQEPVHLLTGIDNAVYAAGRLFWLHRSTLMVQPFDADRLAFSGKPQAITDSFGAHLAGATGGLVVYSTTSRSNSLTWFDRSGRSLGPIGEPGDHHSFALSPDGQRLAVKKFGGDEVDLWVTDLQRNAQTRLTFGSGANEYPVWSPDGESIAYTSGPRLSLFVRDSRGAGVEQSITEPGRPTWANDWSRDGRLLLFHEFAPETKSDLWTISIGPDGKPEAGAKPRPYLRTPFIESHARFAPEVSPRWLMYQSNESGRDEIYVRAFPDPKEKWQISSDGGRFPQWSPDGKEVLYFSAINNLMAVGLVLGKDSIQSSQPRVLFALPADDIPFVPPYTVAADGRRFLVRTRNTTRSESLQVIINWPALVKQGAPGE